MKGENDMPNKFLTFAALALAAASATGAVTPVHIATGSAKSGDTIDYVLISPNAYTNTWSWYIDQRAAVHTALKFAVVDASDIYTEYPYASTNTDGTPRNPAESIHKFIRTQAATGTEYFVLGGLWINAQDLDESSDWHTKRYMRTGEKLTLENAIPGICAWPTAEIGYALWYGCYPSDMFYACTDIAAGTNYPWDYDGDGWYVTSSEVAAAKTDFKPDVVVSRMNLKPWPRENPVTGVTVTHTFEELVTNYVAKLARGEATDFAGRSRYSAIVGEIQETIARDDPKVLLDEHTFYDGLVNMTNSAHAYPADDSEPISRRRFSELMDNRRPYLGGVYLQQHLECPDDGDQTAIMAATTNLVSTDADFLFFNAHGSGSTVVSLEPEHLNASTGLIRFIAGNVSCYSGNVDATLSRDFSGSGTETSYSDLTIADSALSNPWGGSLASINNSLLGQEYYGSFTNLYDGISDELLSHTQDAFFRDNLNAGESWKYALATYATKAEGSDFVRGDMMYVRSAMVEEILFGDPLVQLETLEDVADWEGAAFLPAANLAVKSGVTAIELAEGRTLGAMTMTVPGDLALKGAGSLKIMNGVTVSGSALEWDAAGGVGGDGVTFASEGGVLTLSGTADVYIAKVTNCAKIVCTNPNARLGDANGAVITGSAGESLLIIYR